MSDISVEEGAKEQRNIFQFDIMKGKGKKMRSVISTLQCLRN